jgi:hypothetical protein
MLQKRKDFFLELDRRAENIALDKWRHAIMSRAGQGIRDPLGRG